MPELIPLTRLALAFVPVAIVVFVLFRWSIGGGAAIYAVGRMLVQLLLVGYALAFIFTAQRSPLIIAVLSIMVLAASWISLRTLPQERLALFGKALAALVIGGVPTLMLATQAIIPLEPWFQPDYIIPLAGMFFANAMTAISLSAERFAAELRAGHDYNSARGTALRAALIPITNSLLAVGLVSLPGMMTGQILSGTSPLIAARYQIMVMCLIYGTSGITAAVFLMLLRSDADRIGATQVSP